MRVPNNRLTQYIFTRGIGAIIDKAAEDNPELLDNAQFRTLLKELAVRFFLCDQAVPPDAMPD
ncbi:MAG: hypothetical protein U5K56_04465 [Halioglobus sp.]|nr:hypothetical protein [Halioglobus sp.]